MAALQILYEDERITAVNKPPGLLVIPGRGGEKGATLREQLEAQTGKKIYVLHRLDRGASGLVLFAKDPDAHRELCIQFEAHSIKKTYRVLALGDIERDGMIRAPIRQFGSGRMGVDEAGKPAATRYRVLRRFRAATLLEVEPLTGRQHQIRVHLYHLGHPVIGDPLYGQPRPVGAVQRLMLHAYALAFKSAGRNLRLVAPLPPDFEAILQRFTTAEK